MSRARRTVMFMMHRDGDLTSRSVRLPLWLVRVAGVTGTTLAVLIVLAAILYTPIARTAARVPSLNREIDRLRAENEKVHELAATLEEVEAHYDQMRTMLGGDIVRTRTRADSDLPVAHAVLARMPGETPQYELGPSVPRHWPLREPGIVTRGTVGSDASGGAHSGIDIAVPVGTPIRAAGGGVVVRAGEDPEYGLFVRVQHPEGYETMYGHASRLLADVNDSVGAGQVIALSGSTGRSTAPHLHFEILHQGQFIDPRSLINQES
ncbi:MAG: peptidoglycan DD-metalloendopeptidase family protein [Gemmatimonadales bacterium]|nr:peptidoglycan DD-metalloendopeptidase family protein [Gemmatimonadales bacterium]NIN10406.1 peptidoglycan DD-metalloendopeptidase family protein [Gemmatimonadales bacterium]NIN49198.1 peptidoglycan DD-metalloendopeptidase family protein [Gemmatimonadales bacterium]NIP06662.1 peptidoglycan DD-metalloendopeptidase family protein [Gemmatimonadales bacterium]NIQ99992.1 peptidoglycan DD-metalloendopeptidase family protein [Gemmatimonadales bacterium]